MKVTNENEVKVGAMTLAGLSLFLLVISFLGVFNFAGSKYTVSVIYDQVNGLKKGNEVRFAGVPIGKVDDIVVEGTKIKTILKIENKNKIPVSSKFSIGMDGVMGTKFVSIEPPSLSDGTNYKNNDVITGTEPQGLDQFMASSSKVLDKLEQIADAFNNVFGDKEVQESMRKGFVQTGEITKNLNTFTKVMADSATANQQEIATMISNMRSMSEHMNSLVSNADANGATGQNVAAMAANMAEASQRIENMAKSMEGVVTDPKTKNDLQATIHNARETSDKANKIMSIVTDAKAQADVMYNNENKKWRTDMGVRFPLQGDSFAYLGVADIGDDNKLDFHYNRNINKKLLVRAGIMQGNFGLGADYRLTNKFKLFTDVYDFNDTKLRIGGEWAFNKTFSLIGQSMNVRGNSADNAYIGVRTYF